MQPQQQPQHIRTDAVTTHPRHWSSVGDAVPEEQCAFEKKYYHLSPACLSMHLDSLYTLLPPNLYIYCRFNNGQENRRDGTSRIWNECAARLYKYDTPDEFTFRLPAADRQTQETESPNHSGRCARNERCVGEFARQSKLR